ncbi:MAG: hypothetical protein HC888_07055 [Candidatus Competibacteraceae bacterium]|nr:hypothetical protein [Candidatus Competibacteraceae bacterium]
MKHITAKTAGLCAVLALGAFSLSVGQSSRLATVVGQTASIPEATPKEALFTHITNRAGTRSVWLNLQATESSQILTQDMEIDLSTLTITNGRIETQEFDKRFLIISEGDDPIKLMWVGTILEPGMTQFTFETPLPLRAGDAIRLAPDDTLSGEINLTLVGQPPVTTILAVQ